MSSSWSRKCEYRGEECLSYFSSLVPMIEANLLTVLPLQLLHLPPEEIPIYYSEDRFRSEIPDNNHDFIHRSANIKPVVLRRETGDFLVLRDEAIEPCRAIHISFTSDLSNYGVNLYLYQQLRRKKWITRLAKLKCSYLGIQINPLERMCFMRGFINL